MGLGEGTLILSDIRRLRPFLGVQILNFWGEGGSERWGGLGYDDTVGIFGGPSQNWTIFGSNF